MSGEFAMGSAGPGAEDEALVHRLLVEAGASTWPGVQRCTLGFWLERWSDLAEKVEEGYDRCGPELSFDTRCRRVLAAIWSRLPPRVRDTNQPELDHADARFVAATIPWPGHEDEDEWWEWRVPRLLVAFADEAFRRGWPAGWGMMPFPKPPSVDVEVVAP